MIDGRKYYPTKTRMKRNKFKATESKMPESIKSGNNAVRVKRRELVSLELEPRHCGRGFVKLGGWGCLICPNGRRRTVWILGSTGPAHSWSLGGLAASRPVSSPSFSVLLGYPHYPSPNNIHRDQIWGDDKRWTSLIQLQAGNSLARLFTAKFSCIPRFLIRIWTLTTTSSLVHLIAVL